MIRLRTLGELSLTADDGRDLGAILAQSKRVALLAYLASPSTPRFVPRLTLAGLLWPEVDEERARGSLRSSLYFLRRSLGPDILVSRSEHEVGLEPGRLTCDASDFEEALERGRTEEAVHLYGGEYLPGLAPDGVRAFEEWTDRERRRLRRRAREAAMVLARQALGRSETRAAEGWARRAMAIDPWDEAAVRLLLEALEAGGRRAEALRAYGRFESRVRQELELEPSPETRAVALSLRRDRSGRPPAALDRPPTPGGTAPDGDRPRAPTSLPEERAARDRPDGEAAGATAASRARRVRRAGSGLGLVLTVVLIGLVAVRLGPGDGASPRSARAGPASPDAGGAGRWDPRSDAGARPATTVAILPFTVPNSERDDAAAAYLAAGLREGLVSRLTRMPGLRVLTPDAPAGDRPGREELTALARRLGSSSFLRGTVTPAGDSVRVDVSLVDGRTLTTRWATSLDLTVGAALSAQREFALEVAEALRVRVPRELRMGGADLPRVDPLAARLYLRAARMATPPFVYEGVAGPAYLATIQRLVAGTLERDPDMAAAHEMLASLQLGRGHADSALVEVHRAIALEPEGGAGYHVLGEIRQMQGRPRAVIAAELNALRVPRTAQFGLPPEAFIASAYASLGDHYHYVLWKARQEQLRPASSEPARTRRYGPDCWTLWVVGAAEEALDACRRIPAGVEFPWLEAPLSAEVHMSLGRLAEARDILRRARTEAPHRPQPIAAAGLLELRQGHNAAAERDFRLLLSWTPPVLRERSTGLCVPTALGFALWRQGRRDEARRQLERCRRLDLSELPHGSTEASADFVEYDLARIYAIEGDADSAIVRLRRAIDAGWHWAYTGILGPDDPMMARLRDDRRFRRLMTRVEDEMDRQRRALEAISDSLPPSPELYRRMLVDARLEAASIDTIGQTAAPGLRIDSTASGG